MKTFNLFEKLWEHSRTLRRVGLVLVMCLMAIPQLWAYTIWSATVFYDDKESGWNSNVYFVIEKNGGSVNKGYNGGTQIAMTHIDNTKVWVWQGAWGDDQVTYYRFAKITGTTYGWYDWWKESDTKRVEDSWTWYQTDSWAGVSGGYGATINNETKKFVSTGSSAGASLNVYSVSSYPGDMNYTQNVFYATRANSGATHAKLTSGKAPATISMSSYKYTAGNYSSVTSVSPSDLTVGGTTLTRSFIAGHTATTTLTVSNVAPGYVFDGWYSAASGGSLLESGTTYTYYPQAGADVYARFTHVYGFIEGCFKVKNSTQSTTTYTNSSGTWQTASTNISMPYDEDNRRFYIHTYCSPKTLAEQISSQNAYFFIKTSTSSSSVDGGGREYWATGSGDSYQKLANAGTANKKAVDNDAPAFTFVGNSDNSGYAILYCDGAYIWYELEQTLEYAAGAGSGTAPASRTYYNKGATATAASNTFTAPSGYHFHHWKGSDGNNYAPGANVTMNSNITLTAIWALDYPTGYIYITDVMATPATKAGTTITVTKNSANYKTALSSTFNTNRVGYEEWALTTGSSGSYQLAFSSALDLSSYTGGVDIDVWWGANDYDRTTTLKVNGGSAQALDEVSDSKDRNAVRKATVHTDVTSLSSIQLLCSNGNVAWFRIGIKETATYALTYDDNTDAEVSNMPTSPVNKPAGTITLASEIPTRSGYAFQGWTEDEENEGTVYAAGGSYTMPASAQTLYAKWAQTYTLTYDDGDGSGAPSAEEHVPGSITLSSTEPTRSGYVFLGWTVHGGDGTLYAAGASYTMPSSDVTLDAEWEEICFQATITKTSSSYSISANSSKNITSDATITSGGSIVCYNNDTKDSKSVSFSTDGASLGTSSGYIEFTFPTGTILQTGSVIRIQGAGDNASNGLLLIDDSGTTLASQTNNGAIKFSYEVTALSTINGNDHIRIKRANTSGKNAVKTIIITDCGTVSCTTSPTVEAGSNSSVAVATATVTCASGISSLGSAGCEISDYGFVVGTSTGPVIGGSGVTKHQVGTTDYTSTGASFYKDLTGLTAGTTYYVRPYATNGNGTAYGTETYFTTSTVTMTPTLTNVTHTSGATSGIGGSNYTAVFTASTGYSMPNPTVTIGGNAATIVTDYTWSVDGSVGTITIPANKINGNIAITLNSAKAAPSSVSIDGTWHPFPGETITLTATPTGGNGPKTYQWYKGEDAIDGATNATYTKASCAYEDAGDYWCTVTCAGTESTSSGVFKVKILRLYVKDSKGGDPYGNVDFTKVDGTTATASISLGSGTTYGFNIADGCGHYYGNSGTMQYNSYGPWVTNQDGTDCGLTTTNAGTYIFTINYSNWAQLTTTVTFPSCTDPGLAFASASKSVTLCDDAPTNALTNTHGVTVSYASSNTSVAEVASDGTITLVGAGETTITASADEQTISTTTYCEDNASYTITVTASTAAGLSYGTTTVNKDDNAADFTNTLTNTNSLTGITYTSSNTDVATVNSTTGLVDVKAAGTTIITASSDQQKITSTCYAAGEVSYTLNVAQSYTVEYNAMSGSCATESVTASSVTLPEATRSGYTLEGWYKTDGTKVGVAGGTYNPTADIVLYARWKGAACAGGGGSPTTIVLTDFGKQFSTSGPRYGRAYVGNISGDVHIIESNDAENQKIGDKDSTAIRVDYGSYIKVLGPNATVADYTTDSTFSSVSRVEFRFKMFNASSGGTATTIDVYVGNSKVASAIEVTGEKTDPFKAISPITISPAKNGAVRIVNTGSGSTNKNIYLDSIAITYGGGSSCYQVTYKGNGATSGFVNDPRQYASGGYVFVSSNAGGFAKTGGYEFNGWNTKPDGSGDDYDYDGYDNDHFTITKDTTLYAQWRIVINSNTSDLTAYEDVKHKDVRVTNGATLTITQDTTVRNMLVETGSTLNINTTNGDGTGDGVTLATKSLSLKGGWNDDKTKYDMPRVYIDKKSSLTKEEDVVNFDISVNHRNYYPIALPFDVPLNSVDYARSDLASISDYGVHYAIAEHNGQSRANYGSGTGNWTRMEPGSTLKAGKGYILSAITDGGKAIIRFPMTFTDDWTAEGEQGTVDEVVKNVIPVTAYVKDKGETPIANKGWNLLGVPFMSCYTTGDGMYTGDGMASLIQGRFDYSTGKWTEEDVNVYVTIPTHDFTEYIQSPVGEAVLLPGWCFFVQVDETGDLAFLTAKEAQGTDLPYEAPRRQKASMPTLKTGIILSGAEASDKTTILVSDKYSAAEYEINADLEKMFGENGYTLATYTLSGETRLAYNAMNNADIMDVIPVGYRAPEEGEYTFSINPRYAESEAFEQVNLIDYQEGAVTNLLQSSYSFTTARTQNDARFAINVVKRQDMLTDIKNGASGINDANGPRKVLINDKMYIIVDGKMYDATGKMLK